MIVAKPEVSKDMNISGTVPIKSRLIWVIWKGSRGDPVLNEQSIRRTIHTARKAPEVVKQC